MILYRANPNILGPAASATLGAQSAAYWGMTWDTPLAGAFERLCTIFVQISLSLLVLQSFIHRNAWFYVLSVLYHALIDGVAVILSGVHFGTWPLEGVVFIFALISGGIIYYFYRQDQSQQTRSTLADPVSLPEA
jgi:uncharacterized membrane protein YhfC